MKTATEWSQEFDLLYDNISSGKAPGLTEYEKSVFLTRAQESVVVALYTGHLGDAFEATEAVTDYLATLVKQSKQTTEVTDPSIIDGRKVAGSNSHVYAMPDDMLFRTYEACSLNLGTGCEDVMASVTPVTQDELFKTLRNPFKGFNGNRVLRLAYANSTVSTGSTPVLTVKNYSELITDKTINYYLIRYIARPEPIILETSASNPTIENSTTQTVCKLPDVLHQTILTEAVKLAKAVWNS